MFVLDKSNTALPQETVVVDVSQVVWLIILHNHNIL